MRHLVTLFDLTSDEVETILHLASELKQQVEAGRREPLLQGRVLGLLFQKPSLRTRLSFQCGMAQLGGSSLFLGKDVGWGEREAIQDFAPVLGQYIDVLACRANCHDRVEELANYCGKPVINALTDYSHPCQALADVLTLRELHAGSRSLKLAYVGDANNVARSLAVCCAKLNIAFAVAAPAPYQFDSEFTDRLAETAPNWRVEQTENPADAVADAAAVYTDVWTSMGQETERQARLAHFADFQINAELDVEIEKCLDKTTLLGEIYRLSYKRKL